jgi:hypothetical protein
MVSKKYSSRANTGEFINKQTLKLRQASVQNHKNAVNGTPSPFCYLHVAKLKHFSMW